ncbi:MAG TPA: class I SAM-dependent methyltransferase [Solirubrobacterales bacterium]|jgi:ubiquinone/menaquinone biosynthesis C-methylase UbiE
MTESNEHPERFDPAESAGTLMDAEHRCRYWWAAQVAAGKDVLDAACGTGYGSLILAEAESRSVTGIDISADAVGAAKKRVGDRGSIEQGDVHELPSEDDSFDLVVCFETIEHVADGAAVIAEFRRVLRPDGLLLISSPNPGVYPAGNEHHVHEYSPKELSELVGASFPDAVEHLQHPWIASAIRPVGDSPMEEVGPVVKGISELAPGHQTYTLLAAGKSELPDLAALVTLGDGFEVRWWEEHVAEVERHFTRELAASLEREHAAGKRLNDANGRVVTASEELSRFRAMESHYGELRVQNEQLSTHYDIAITRLREIESSRAWKLLAPLRRLRGG